jgi:micrococcal nuclease
MIKTIRNAVFATGLLLAAITASATTTKLVALLGTQWPLKSVGQAAPSNQVAGKVIYVDDGDTVIVLLADNSKLKVRLASIDAPEVSHTNHETGRIGQPYSDNSKRFLESLVHGRQVIADCPEQDKYGRSICTLTVGGVNVNAEMVRNGWAWANTANSGRYLRDRTFVGLQEEARLARKGLWQGRQPVEPWEWRHVCWESNGTSCPM